LFLFVKLVLQFLVLATGLDMLDMFCPSCSLVNMVNLISIFLLTICLLYLWIKYHGKVLIFPTIQKPYFRQFTPDGFCCFDEAPLPPIRGYTL
jgi:hypothetical protein